MHIGLDRFLSKSLNAKALSQVSRLFGHALKTLKLAEPEKPILNKVSEKSVFFAYMNDIITSYEPTNLHDTGVILDLSKRVDIPKRLNDFQKHESNVLLEQAWAYTLKLPEFYKLYKAKYKSPKFAIEAYKKFLNQLEVRLDKKELPSFELGMTLLRNRHGFQFDFKHISFGGTGQCWHKCHYQKKNIFQMFFHNHPNSMIMAAPSEPDLAVFSGEMMKNRYFSAYIYSQYTRTGAILSPKKTAKTLSVSRFMPAVRYIDKFNKIDETIIMHVDYPLTQLKLSMGYVKSSDPLIVQIDYIHTAMI